MKVSALLFTSLFFWGGLMGKPILTKAKAEPQKTTFQVLNVNELEKMMNENKQLSIYDANVESTRFHVGLIPGAKLLSSSSNYDVSSTLPTDKKANLIFYCANKECTASHTAAERALAAGYKNVYVMVDGIYGWQKAGKKTVPAYESGAKIRPQVALDLQTKKRAVIVDVREAEERHEVIPNALWFPTSKGSNKQSWLEFVNSLPKDEMIIFHCAVGARSKRIAEKLKGEGFMTAYFEGPDQWKSEGLKLEKGPAKYVLTHR